MFVLETSTKAKLMDIAVLSQKSRPPDSNPGVALSFTAELPNSALTMLDGFLRGMLYTKAASSETPPQKGLDGVEPISDLPNLTAIGAKIGRFGWGGEQTGCKLTFDFGLGGKSDITLKDVKVDSIHVHGKEGGTTTWSWKCEINDVDEAVFGKLATFKSREVQVLLAGPEVDLLKDAAQSKNPGSDPAWPFPNGAPGSAEDGAKKPPKPGSKAAKEAAKSATQEFLGQHGTAEA